MTVIIVIAVIGFLLVRRILRGKRMVITNLGDQPQPVDHEAPRFAKSLGILRESLAVDPGASGKKGSDARRARRRSYPIHAYVGANGSGKSLAMVHDTLPSLAKGRKVISTVRLLDYIDPHLCGDRAWDVCDDPAKHDTFDPSGKPTVHGAAHRCYVPLRDYQQIMDARQCDILLDEVTGVASSRSSHSMPEPIANILNQLRRQDVVLRWTAPNWSRADIIIREVSQAVTRCQGFVSETAPMLQGEDRLWRDKRLFRWRTYDAADFEEFTTEKGIKLGSKVQQWFWRPGKDAPMAYDTRDSVSSIGYAAQGGSCMTCGGHRARPKCSCDNAPAAGRSGGVSAGAPARPKAAEVPAESHAAISVGIAQDTSPVTESVTGRHALPV